MRRNYLLGGLLLALATGACAQDGAVDLKFAAGKGASDDIYDVSPVPSPGGGFLIAGHFTAFDGRERWRIARLHPDGSLDETFDPRDSAGSAPVSRVIAQADGGVLIAGPFSRFDGRTCRLVARLKGDGALDAGFDANDAFGSAAGAVQALAITPEGRILVAGRFDSPALHGRSRGIVRLRADGRLDETFLAGIRVAAEGEIINAVAPLSEGRLIAAGQFSPAGNLTRLEANGAIDPAFRLAERDGVADAMIVQPDGKIVAAFSDGARRWISRLLPDGALDPDFHAEPLADESRIETLALQRDGALLVGGSFHAWAGVRRDGVARLKPDGALDKTFDPGAGVAVLPVDDPDETPDATVRALLPLPDGHLLIAGRFDLYNGAPCHNLARIFNAPH